MQKRGVMYCVWGERPRKVLDRSIASLKKVHPELPVEVVELEDLKGTQSLLQKARMQEMSPFEETLFLDADTVILDRLDFGFEKAVQFGLACCICENPWARRYNKSISGDTIEYNTGVLFFSRKAEALFEGWKELSAKVDSSCQFLANGQMTYQPHNDQASFAMAVQQTQFFPFVLPFNWNFRPQIQKSFFGPIKIWHDYDNPPLLFYELAEYYKGPSSLIQYHFQR